jgi:hypothetical protein
MTDTFYFITATSTIPNNNLLSRCSCYHILHIITQKLDSLTIYCLISFCVVTELSWLALIQGLFIWSQIVARAKVICRLPCPHACWLGWNGRNSEGLTRHLCLQATVHVTGLFFTAWPFQHSQAFYPRS